MLLETSLNNFASDSEHFRSYWYNFLVYIFEWISNDYFSKKLCMVIDEEYFFLCLYMLHKWNLKANKYYFKKLENIIIK